MKKFFIVLVAGFNIAVNAFGAEQTDTLYYNRDWKGVESEAFAT